MEGDNSAILAEGKLAQRGHMRTNRLDKTFFNTRCSVNVGTFNSRTLTAKWRRMELVSYCIQKEIEILAIQEHRIHFNSADPIRRERFGNGWFFVYTSADDKGGGGVGFLISARVYKFINSVKSVSPRILQINIKDYNKIASCFYSIYSPTSCAEVGLVEEFYSALSDSVSGLAAAVILFILGDFNAMLPVSGDVLFSPNIHDNRNTNMLVDFLLSHDLVPVNTLFQKRRSLVSFYGPNNRRVLLDYILVRKKWCKSVRDCNSKCPASVASDHKVVMAKVKWRLKNNTNVKSRHSKDLRCVKDPECAKSISSHVVSQFCSTGDFKQDYTLFSQLAREAVDKYVPDKVRVSGRKPWEDEDIVGARRELVKAKLNFHQSRTDENRQRSAQCAKILSDLYVRKENEWYSNLSEQLMQLSGDHQYKEVWNQINYISGRKARVSATINADSEEQRVRLWVEHFQKLLSPAVKSSGKKVVHAPALPGVQLGYDTSPFVMSELKSAVKSLSNGKASGLDGLPNELLKLDDLHQLILDIINRTYAEKSVPVEWLVSVLIPVFKKGSAGDPGNYRGIALMCTCAKLYNKLLLGRLRSVLDSHLRVNQNGFRQLRSTAQQVLSVRRLFEAVRMTRDAKVVAIFVDFCKAFDSVSWVQMEAILIAYQVPLELVAAIMSMYCGAQAGIQNEDGEVVDENRIDLSVGVLQGDTLAPYLFVIVMDFVLRKAMIDSCGVQITKKSGTSSRPNPATFLSDLDFADDIVLFGADISKAQRLLSSLEKVALTVGLKINRPKTEYLLVGDWGDRTKQRGLKIKDGPISLVEDYKYLGSWLLSSRKDFTIRRDLAWKAHKKLFRIWKSKTITRNVKINIFRATVESVLLYNATTWTMTEGLEKSLDGAYTKLLRYALGIRWQDRVKNEDLYGTLPKISVRLRERRLTFAGHCWRSPQSAPQPVSDLLFWSVPNGVHKKGNFKTYVHVLLKDYTGERKKVVKDNYPGAVQQLKNAMEDRGSWRRETQKSAATEKRGARKKIVVRK